MAIHTLDQNVTPVAAIAVAVTVATITSPAIDTIGYRRALAIFQAQPTGASATVNVKVQECATSSGSYTDIVGTDTTTAGGLTMADGHVASGFSTTAGAAAGPQVLMINIDLAKRLRFLKVVVTGAVAGGGGAAATVLLYEPQGLGTATGAYSIHV